MWPSSRLFTAERDGYFAICPPSRLNSGEGEVDVREQRPQPPPENLRAASRFQVLVVRSVAVFLSVNSAKSMFKNSFTLVRGLSKINVV